MRKTGNAAGGEVRSWERRLFSLFCGTCYNTIMEKVLVAVLKCPEDLDILLREKWYRIPIKYAPKREYRVIAFYQNASFGARAKRIEYYGITGRTELCKRGELVKDGLRPDEKYIKVQILRTVKLKKPVINRTGMRVLFKYTVFSKLYSSADIGELFNIPDIDGPVEDMLKALRIKYKKEFTVTLKNKKRYRFDFALFTGGRIIDLECDGEKWHALKARRLYDAERDKALIAEGYEVVRLKESVIVEAPDLCFNRIKGLMPKGRA